MRRTSVLILTTSISLSRTTVSRASRLQRPWSVSYTHLELIDRLVNFKGLPQELNLPSAPKQFIRYMEEDNRPQVALDVNYENGMGVSIGRLREDTRCV